MYSSTEKQMKRSLKYFKNLKNIMEAHETKAKSVQFRRHLLQRQKVANYQNEKERIMGEIAQAEQRGLVSARLKQRKAQLNQLIRDIN
mgnify:CR=1 FL=1